jgi:mycothiol synthase
VDAPDAFQPLDPVLAESDEYWQEITGSLASSDSDVLVVEHRDEAIGMVYVRIDEQRVGHIGAMWVDPKWQGSGLGRQLLDDSIQWNVAREVTTISLWVTEGNLAATSLYESSGFVPSGISGQLRPGADVRIIEMELSVTQRTSHGPPFV